MDTEEGAEIVLAQLMCDLRKLKSDQPVPTDEVRKIKIIKRLENEKAALAKNIELTRDQLLKNFTNQRCNEVMELFKEYKALGQEYNDKMQEKNELQLNIDDVKGKIDDMYKDVVHSEDMDQKAGKETSILSSSLHTAVILLNSKISGNDTILQQVESLLRDRDRFLKQFDKLSSELRTGDKIINNIIEQSNTTCDRRKEGLQELNWFKSKTMHKMLAQNSVAMDLARSVDHTIRTNEFMTAKKKHREETDYEVTSESEVTDRSDLDAVVPGCTAEGDLEQYEELIGKLQSEFGGKNVKKLAPKFVRIEKDNYSGYTYVNELNHKVVSLCDEVTNLHKQIENEREVNAKERQAVNANVSVLMEEYGAKMASVADMTEKLNLAKQQEIVVLEDVKKVFDALGGNMDGIKQRLGSSSEVSRDNVRLFLTALEKRLEELTFFLRYRTDEMQRKSASFPTTLHKLYTPLPMSPCPVCAKIKDSSELDETVAVVMDVDSMRAEIGELLDQGARRELLHSVAECGLPESRRIIQKGEINNV